MSEADSLNGEFIDVNASRDDAIHYPVDAPIVGVDTNFYSQGQGIAKHGDDSSLIVRFYNKKIVNRFQSKVQGKEVSEEKEYVMLRGPGRLGTEVHHEVRPDLIARFRRQYNRWKAGLDQIVGTPIMSWDLPNDDQKQLLMGMQILTIEQLANVNDVVKQELGPNLNYLVEIAKDFVSKQTQKEVPKADDGKLKSLEEQNEKLMKANMNLLERVERLEGSSKEESKETKTVSRSKSTKGGKKENETK